MNAPFSLSLRLRWLGAACGLIGLLGACGFLIGAKPVLSEYDVKALYLRKFISYIEWPEEAPAAIIRVGVLGENPFGQSLEEAMKDVQKDGRSLRVEVKTYSKIDDAVDCHLLFIGRQERAKISTWLKLLKDRPIFTAVDSGTDDAEQAVLQFVDVRSGLETKVRFDVNLHVAQARGLKISSQMLQSARKVNRPVDEKGGPQ